MIHCPIRDSNKDRNPRRPRTPFRQPEGYGSANASIGARNHTLFLIFVQHQHDSTFDRGLLDQLMRPCGVFQFHAPLDGGFDLAFFQQAEERTQVLFEPFRVLFTQVADGIERGLTAIVCFVKSNGEQLWDVYGFRERGLPGDGRTNRLIQRSVYLRESACFNFIGI